MPILEVNRVQKIYTARSGGSQVQALRSVSFDVEQGEYVAIMGESGSGKTTLLNILAALDKPTAGTVLLDGRDLSGIKSTELSAFRRDHLGFVFQDFNLLDTLSLQDNLLLPLVLAALESRSTDELLELFAQVNREGQTLLMVTHSVKAASHAGRVLFIRDGEVYHQLYRGKASRESFYQKITDTLTVLATGGERQ